MAPARKEPDMSTYRGRCAARLKELREKAGLTHNDIATLCDVSSRAVYNWEAAEADPKVEYLPILAKAFKVKSPREILSQK